jgi:integrase
MQRERRNNINVATADSKLVVLQEVFRFPEPMGSSGNCSTAEPTHTELQPPPDGRATRQTLLAGPKPVKVCAVKVPSQRDGRSMNRRPGQRGAVYIIGEKLVGRYREDVPGRTNRKRVSVEIGSIHEMTRPQAERWLAQFIERNGINSAAHLERSRTPVINFGEAATAWKERHLTATKKPSSQRSMTCELRNHILPLLKDTPMEDVNYPTIRGLIAAWQKKGLSTKSTKNLFGIVRAVYNFYLDERAQSGTTTLQPWLIKWKKIKPVTDIEEEPSCFEEEQMAAIVYSAKNQMHRALYALAAGSGARVAEMFALRCEDLDLQLEDGTGMMTIRRTVFEGKEFTTKSNKVRRVPIDASVAAELQKHLNGRRHGYVFQTRNGTALRESNILPDLHAVLEDLEIPRSGFHSFRHGRCSFLVRSDVSRAVIREWLGHGSEAMIDRYSHKLGKYGKAEMARLRPTLDSSWTQIQSKESGASSQAVVN